MTHEQVGHGPRVLADILDRAVRPHLNEVSVELIARLTGRPANDPVTRIRAMTLHGQLMVFDMAPRKVETFFGPDTDGQRLVLLKDLVRQQTRVLMDSWNA